MSSFHLRPVVEHSPSPPSSASTTTQGDHSPLHKSSVISPQSGVPRRPLSPSSLRDVNLTQDGSSTPRKYPAPPTGHELMALFPPAPPANFAEMRPGPTSGFFQRQERAFFAQAGREIVRVRVEIDVPQQEDSSKSREPPQSGPPRSWPQLPPHPQHHSPIDSPMGPYGHHGKGARPSRSMPTPTQAPSMFPVAPHGQPAQPPLNLHQLRSPPHEVGAKVEIAATEDYRDDSDDAWRRPTPYADRRRAGKHTKRIVVRN
ncbi:hypothetical protein P692DRAFT_20789094 [Suillus brevipes Sb2]|nr:hypothetical protein P692DRAFT_20789094 [Suillus brevipes Sb2]